MKWIAIFATFVIIIVIPVYTWIEPRNQQDLVDSYHVVSVLSATDVYAENCALCHGASGEGIGDNPPLNSEAVRSMSESDLVKTIARGRSNTLMAAWGLEEGGVLSNSQLNDMVILIQFVNWEFVSQRVAELGLTPPDLIEFEVSDEMLTSLASLPDGERLGQGLTIYAENCAACHNSNGSGTLIAPAIDSQELRNTPMDQLLDLVNNGVAGSLMASWQGMLTPEEIDLVVSLIYRWPEMVQAGFEFPETEMMSLPSSPEMIAAGDSLFHVACRACHGEDAYGTRMAPALNNQLFLSQTPDAAIYQIIAGGVSETLMPAWGNRLTDYDLQTLVAYLRSLEIYAPPIVPPITDN